MDAYSMQESENQFRAQFDRNHPSYHGNNGLDDQRVVPTGMEKRIPKGMEGEAPHPVSPPLDDNIYGEEFLHVKDTRVKLGDMKKILGQLCPPIERIMALTKRESTPSIEEKIEEYRLQRMQVISGLEEFPCESFDISIQESLESILSEATTEFESKLQYGEFVQKIRRLTQDIFRHQRILMKKMKDIKKSHRSS